jgi:transcriptional regulator with XRE-family HTH domain
VSAYAVPMSHLEAVVASALRQLRQAAYLTQDEVARACNVTTWTVNRWERPEGAPVPLLRHRRRLAELYGVSVEALGLG